MGRCFCGPETESVMMFTYKNDPIQSALFAGFDDIFCIKIDRIENVRRFITKSPFFICIRVHTEMHNGITGMLCVFQYPFGRNPAVIVIIKEFHHFSSLLSGKNFRILIEFAGTCYTLKTTKFLISNTNYVIQ